MNINQFEGCKTATVQLQEKPEFLLFAIINGETAQWRVVSITHGLLAEATTPFALLSDRAFRAEVLHIASFVEDNMLSDFPPFTHLS